MEKVTLEEEKNSYFVTGLGFVLFVCWRFLPFFVEHCSCSGKLILFSREVILLSRELKYLSLQGMLSPLTTPLLQTLATTSTFCLVPGMR